MAINFHPADALIHRLLQQQGSSLNQRTSSQQGGAAGPSEKVTISDRAREAAGSESASGTSASKFKPNLLELYGPRGA
ncbi:hypothetical protein Ga0123462_2077 [Mariprofundus ferrinatatus]|uniref:Uncharacterized protein n=1 Tax=Mariprofundus ferrinatatus TaxID=1921087 RepID=A0A2K8L720_9PROT|nr:hypothetical protein [Mariprofundus ferrinatatus]ATX82912.1 hypothetical protein Ga0123462_2077 [Mariprofundus ferrinatatus]